MAKIIIRGKEVEIGIDVISLSFIMPYLILLDKGIITIDELKNYDIVMFGDWFDEIKKILENDK